MRSSQPFVSVIIPVRRINHFLLESMPYLQELNWPNYEILIFSDEKQPTYRWPKTKIIASGKVGPAEKRDLAIQYAKGEIFAFLDDDAFPTTDWLQKAIPHFEDPKLAAVGGPGITPLSAPFLEKASGWASASPIGAGPYTYRFLPTNKKFVDDFPSMNLLVRRKDFVKIGGFDSHYYPGEDTKLCLDLTNLGKKIIYEPQAIVYHHRRPLWLPHLKQNGNFGIHRGFFARVLPQTSARPIYFFPMLLDLNLICLIVSWFISVQLFFVVSTSICLYLFMLLVNAVWIGVLSRSIALACVSVPAILLTHIWYGIRFFQGFFFTKQLKQ